VSGYGWDRLVSSLALYGPPLAVVVSLAGAALLAALLPLTRGRVRPLAPCLALLGPLATLGAGLYVSSLLMVPDHVARAVPPQAPWTTYRVFSGTVRFLPGLQLGWSVDGLSALMLVIVGFVACMVVVFSVGYMSHDKGYVRYFALLSLFTAAMTTLVISNSLLGIFMGWELVGACSYLLIGFWYDQPIARDAALKAFLVTRLGDAGFMLGLAVLWTATGTLSLTGVMAAVPSLAPALVTVAALLLFAGAAGKSAQFPLHVWLPDAMAGPTPVSALIHAATMVAAGVFLIARVWPLFEASPAARTVILVLAVITALGAAIAALPQRDIKKVLAYSTISQLGFMFAALGVGAWPAAMFHLTTHAAFKALLFLGSGSVIHATETQDLHEMGGLARKMPITAITWIVGAAALAGVPPLSGFFSKDEVLGAVVRQAPWAGVFLFAAAALTAVYITRATWLAFFGRVRGDHHAHESGPAMAIPLVMLAIPAALLGFASPWIMELLGVEHEPLFLPVAIASAAIALAGIAVGWWVWRRGPSADEELARRAPDAWALACEAFRVDVLYDGAVRGTVSVATALYKVVDRDIIDRAVEGTGTVTERLGGWFARLQNGDAQDYSILVGVALVAFAALGALAVWQGW
jgi:NADH-quinone oxidoreductase subunit L